MNDESPLSSVLILKIVHNALLAAARCLDLDRSRWRNHYLQLSLNVICRSAHSAASEFGLRSRQTALDTITSDSAWCDHYLRLSQHLTGGLGLRSRQTTLDVIAVKAFTALNSSLYNNVILTIYDWNVPNRLSNLSVIHVKSKSITKPICVQPENCWNIVEVGHTDP